MTMDAYHYVYRHKDPDTGAIRYVGKGSGGRAWVTERVGQPKLTEQLKEWLIQGYVPSEWVEIVAQRLTREEAFEMEKELIERYEPDLNCTQWDWSLTLTTEQIACAKALRAEGMSYEKVAKEIGTSTMTVYRLINNVTKGYSV